MDDVLVLVQPQLVQNDIGDFAPAGPPLKQQIFGSINSVNRAEWYSACLLYTSTFSNRAPV